MSRIAQKISMGALIAIGVWLPATSAQAQSPAHVRVAIDSVHPLAEAALAHRRLEGRATSGKLLLDVR